MWIEKLAVTAQEAFKSAMDIASKHEAATTEPLHLLDAILSADENNLRPSLRASALILLY